MEKMSEYNKQYIQKKTDSCHVPILDNSKGKDLGYEFSEVDETGHRWYSLKQGSHQVSIENDYSVRNRVTRRNS